MSMIDADRQPIDLVIYMHDESGIMLKVQNGQNVDAAFLFDLVVEELDLNDEDVSTVKEVFSLWLVSDLLELQLKPNHIPFKLVCYWEELLEKYVHCSEETRQRDEPVIMMQRNVYVTQATEERVTNQNLLKLLYCEAKKNVLCGKYPVSCDLALDLAMIQTQILYLEKKEEWGKLPSFEFFSENYRDLLPAVHCKRNFLLNRKQNPEYKLSNLYETKTGHLAGMNEPSLYNEYIKICKNIFLYGSAFFRGQAERLGKKVDDPVWVAVNNRGVSVVCINDQALLLTAPFEKLSWQFAESASTDQNYLPCLFLHFPYAENNVEVTKLLQIFSRSAFLADNLIEAFVALKKQRGGPLEPAHLQVTAHLDRLALMTFDGRGKKLRSTIRLPKHQSIKSRDQNV